MASWYALHNAYLLSLRPNLHADLKAMKSGLYDCDLS